jgi:probable phosphoglycerate mutase
VTRLILWRHGETEWNEIDRVQGQTDVILTERGRAQAEAAAKRLLGLHPDALISSDLKRTAETAAALAALTGLRVELDARLRERYYGEWQGRTLTEIAERWPREYARWRAGDPSPGCGVEHIDELAKRVTAALGDIVERFPGSTVVVTTHGGAARTGCAGMLGWPPDVAQMLAGLYNCHWVDLRLDNVRGWQLVAYNAGV